MIRLFAFIMLLLLTIALAAGFQPSSSPWRRPVLTVAIALLVLGALLALAFWLLVWPELSQL